MSKHLSMDIRVPIELDNPSIMRFEEKCIKCGMCRDICRDYIGVHGTYSLKDTNDTAVCINCGNVLMYVQQAVSQKNTSISRLLKQ